MTFKLENLTPLNNGKNGKVPVLWTYWNEGGDTLTAAGFFPLSSGLKAGDQITVINADYTEQSTGYITEALGALTFTAHRAS